MRPLILVGGGGHCKSVIEAAESSGVTIKGILDLPEHVGTEILGYPVIGTDHDVPLYVKDADFVVTLGFIKDPSRRIQLHDLIEEVGGHFATVIASTAYISKHAIVQSGTVVLHQAVINADAVIGKGCIINTFASIGHDAVIEDFCHISTGVMITGSCRVGKATFIGSQSVVVNNITITDESIVAAGSVVSKNICQKGLYAGNPALLKQRL
jgi:sugar O-acyltransferase (sialic acid O-acetyltransferase NeuD family)